VERLTHVIDHSNANGIDQNGLKAMNQGKNEREKRNNAKNKM
jgi:hypothetical protein